MNHTTLAIVAVLAAAALVIGTFATTTVASPAFAKTSSKTQTQQKNYQDLSQSGKFNFGANIATNMICINSRPCIVG